MYGKVLLGTDERWLDKSVLFLFRDSFRLSSFRNFHDGPMTFSGVNNLLTTDAVRYHAVLLEEGEEE